MNSLRIEGQKTIAIELLQQFHWEVPDWVIIPGGNLGNVSALGKGFLEGKQMGLIDKLPRLAVAQAAPSQSALSQLSRRVPHLCAANGPATPWPVPSRSATPVSRERAIRTLQHFDGIVEEATEDELANACARADHNGLFTCPHTGVALAALEKMVAAGHVESQSRVIVISTAHGLKFPDFKVKYHEDQLREFHVEPQHRNMPVEVEAEYEAVHRAVLEAVAAAAHH